MLRREFVRWSGLAAASSVTGQLVPDYRFIVESALTDSSSAVPEALAADESFWLKVRRSYVTSSDLIDFDNANTAPTPAPVFEAYVRNGQRLRHAPAESFNRMWSDQVQTARVALARHLDADPKHVMFMLNATVALNTVLHGFPMERGDEILVTNHEYPDMIETVVQRSRREGVAMRVVNVPLPSEDSLDLVARVKAAIGPRTKLLLISHVSAWSGEVLPIREVCAAARASGVAVLVDAAQSVGILDVSFKEIGCDFLATSLHKWLAAPMGTGALIMRPEHFGKVLPLHPPAWDTSEYPTDLYEWTGTFNMAAFASVTSALDFLKSLGVDRKRARARYLGDYWQQRLAAVPRIRILTPRTASRSLGVASFMIDGMPSKELAKYLRTKGLLVQDKTGRYSPFTNAVRVSPGVYATNAELERFVSAIKEVATNGIPASKT